MKRSFLMLFVCLVLLWIAGSMDMSKVANAMKNTDTKLQPASVAHLFGQGHGDLLKAR